MRPYFDLPREWRWARLGDLSSQIDYGLNEEASQDGGGQPFLRISDVNDDGQLNTEGRKYLTSPLPASASALLCEGDIVIARSGSIGRSYLVRNSEAGWAYASYLIRFRPRREVIDPEYLIRVLISHLFRGYVDRVGRTVAQPNINSIELSRFLVPLPTLVEQQRIVDVLRQAETAVEHQQSRRQQLDLMIKSALDHLVLSRDESEWERLGALVETRYGTSVAAGANAESGTAVLRIPNVVGGEVDTENLKYVHLAQTELKRLSLTAADVLIVRSNGNPDYVGRSAPITEDVAMSSMVYASYLIRLRTDTARLLPEYLSAFLNSAFGRAALRNAIRTTAGQSNLSGENLIKVRLPVPPLAEQKLFRDFWLQVRQIRRLIAKSEDAANELRAELSIHALSGDMTTAWRDKHAAEVAEAAHARDALMRARGAKVDLASNVRVTTTVQLDVPVRPARNWLLGELSEFQRQVLAAFTEYCQHSSQPLLIENPEEFARFCDGASVTERLQDFGFSLGDRIRRSLSQLAALGLIAEVKRPMQDSESGERDYRKILRPLRPDEFTRMADVQALRKALSSDVDQRYYHFAVQLDYETSERAGAGGMFQVISLKDDDGKEFTHLVDQGQHYASLDALKEDIAGALNVEAGQIELETV